MIKTLKNVIKSDAERFTVPKSVQDTMPVKRIYADGIFQVGKNKYSKMYRFDDINYAVASREDKEAMFLEYCQLLNAFDSGATTKLTINNRRLDKKDFAKRILLKETGDGLDEYRREYNGILEDKATDANAIMQDKYITVSVVKKDIDEARTYFSRTGAELVSHFARLGAVCRELEAGERMKILQEFYRSEECFDFDIKERMGKGSDFRDYFSPDSLEMHKDYFKIGKRYGRVLFLRDYANYIKDSMVSELTDISRNLMLSIDVVPVPTDEAVKEVEAKLLGVETNISATRS